LGKIQALLAAKRSPVCWGSQMCLNVRGIFYFLSIISQHICYCRIVFHKLAPNGRQLLALGSRTPMASSPAKPKLN